MFSVKAYSRAWLRNLVITLTLMMSIMALQQSLTLALVVGGAVYNLSAFVMS